jgi:Tol biopolymer transport system component
MLFRWSGDARWLFFAIDPQGSGSIAADGLFLQVVSARGGTPHTIAPTLAYDDYLSWCGRKLVFAAGGDRLATNRKRLLVASPPSWRPRPLVRTPNRAWGSVACARDNRSVVVQSQRRNEDYNFFHSAWALWKVGLDGSQKRLTSPPARHADESPRISKDGRTVLFIRSHAGHGLLYALRGGRLLGPLLSVGFNAGFYGHRDWWADAEWSNG